MKKRLFFYCLCLLAIGSYAQSWYQVNSNTTQRLKDIVMINATTGFCSGGGDVYNAPEGNGVILKTTDGGENWTTVFSQANLAIYAIHSIANEMYAFAKLNGGNQLLHSADSGVNWSITTISFSPYNVQYANNAIYFLDANDNYALKKWTPTTLAVLMANVGTYGVNNNEIVCINSAFDSIYKSTDGGTTFTQLSGYPTEFGQNQSTNAVIKSFGTTLVVHYTYPAATQVSTDNGISWTHMGYDGANGSAFANYCEIIADNLLLGSFSTTLNSQQDYQAWETDVTLSHTIRKIAIYSGNLGFVLGDNGMIYKTNSVEGLATTDVTVTQPEIRIINHAREDALLIENTSSTPISSITLYDVQGKQVAVLNGNITKINTSHLAKGTYIICVATSSNSFSEKVFIR